MTVLSAVLRSKQEAVVNLYVQGHTRKEIALEVEYPLSTVCRILRRSGITKQREMQVLRRQEAL